MTQLDPEAVALIRAARGGDAPTAEERAQVLQGFRAQQAAFDGAVLERTASERAALAAAAPGRTDTREAARSAPRGSRRGERRVVSWSLAAVVFTGSVAALANWSGLVEGVVWVLGGVVPQAESSSSESSEGEGAAVISRTVKPRAVRQGSVASQPSEATIPPEAAVPFEAAVPSEAQAAAEAAALLAPPPALPSRDTSAVPSVPSAAERSTTSEVSAETAVAAELPGVDVRLGPELSLITAARDALRHGQFERARELSSRHAREFPQGELALERETILALADCRQRGDARRAREFVAAHPGSLFASRVARECQLPNSVPAPSGAGTYPAGAIDIRAPERTP